MLTALVLQLIQCVVALPTKLAPHPEKKQEPVNNVSFF